MAVHPHQAVVSNNINSGSGIVAEFEAAVDGTMDLFLLETDETTMGLGGEVIFDIKINNVSIYAAPEDRPRLTGTQLSLSDTTISEAVVTGDRIRVELLSMPSFKRIGPKTYIQLNIDDGTGGGGGGGNTLGSGTAQIVADPINGTIYMGDVEYADHETVIAIDGEDIFLDAIGKVRTDLAVALKLPSWPNPAPDGNGDLVVDNDVTGNFSHGVPKIFSLEELGFIVVPVAELAALIEGSVLAYDATAKEFKAQKPKLRVFPFSAAHGVVALDGNSMLYHPSSDNNARTVTIPANGTLALPVGTVFTVYNEINDVTIAITTDTLTWVEGGVTGSRIIAANGMATIVKVDTTKWVISGTGIS